MSALVVLALVAGLSPRVQAQDIAVADAYAQKAAETQRMRASMITQAQREAAAAELKAFKLKIEQAKKAALKTGATRPESIQLPPGGVAPGQGGFPDYFTTANWAYSPELRKFVDTLPGLTAAGANNLGNFIGVAVPDTISYPGSDYYEISVEQYTQKFHSDLPPTTLRGYRQTNFGTDANGANTVAPPPISYLGPVIVSRRDRPVRIKFTNNLPTGQGGDLFVPVDETIMGAGKGPLWPISAIGTVDPLTGQTITATSACDPSPVQSVPPGNATHGQNCAKYPQNRAAIHLHGGRTPWISDGTPHQWIIPAAEWSSTPYKEGVSLENVPDMPNPGPGSTTYYYTNQQSARLMFYHDHAWGITRLNVLVGMAAGYIIRDEFEDELVNSGVVPAAEIPLVIQDKSFVAPDVLTTDPTWNWGTGTPDLNGVRPVVPGDLWMPHVYVPAQNPYDPTGTNPFGRWVYGPWFFPPTTNLYFNTVPNPYHDPACSDPDPAVFAFCTTPGQPPVVPGTPHPSVGMETFFDTMMVNGAVYPTVTVQPQAYRFRILNAANDRFVNLNLYKADATQVSRDGRTGTEVKMVPAAAGFWDQAALPTWPADGRDGGVPDPATVGPQIIQIGTEGGFLPRPAVIPHQPIDWIKDPTAFAFGIVSEKALFLGPAERADAIIDFSQFAGQTLILYNDAPAAVPARDPRFDYYTGAADLSATGGYGRVPGTTGVVPCPACTAVEGPQVGFGPNIRTIMQIKVAAAPGGTTPTPFNLAALEAAFAPNPATGKLGIFERGQDPIVVGQDAYNGIYTGVTFPVVWPYWGFSRIQDTTLNIMNAAGQYQTLPMEPKGIHDEMGAAFDMEYGRMSGNLGLHTPQAVVGLVNFTLYKYPDPATEILNDAVAPGPAVLGDGTQIWKISQNGVDTHPIHFHIFDVQLINRVGWDGQIRPPDANELGWKDTIRINPLEDTIVAMRPWAPKLPFNVPSSLRPLNPSIPLNSPFGFTNIDPITQQAKVPPDLNRIENLGWEYVWHCHILSHEENDMMRPIVLNVTSAIPGAPSPLVVVQNALGQPVLSWVDATPVNYLTQAGFGAPNNEIAFRVERSPGIAQPYVVIGFAQTNTTTFTDTTTAAGLHYHYRVVAYNEAGAAVSNSVEFGPPEVNAPATGVTLGASPLSPYVRTIPATPVVFTAQATGGTGVYEYRFSVNRGAGFVVVQQYTASNVYTMPITEPGGTFDVKVDVRTGSVNDLDVSTTLVGYQIVDPAQATVTLSADPALPSPGYFGTPVTFTAVGAGSAGYQYRFWLGIGGNFGVAPTQDWSPAATWILPGTLQPGSYQVKVDVRTTTGRIDASATVPYEIVYRPATTLSLVASRPSPYVVGLSPVALSFLATGGGSAGTPTTGYQYRFLMSQDFGATFTEVQPWGAGRVYAMPANSGLGNYLIRAETRTSTLVTLDTFAGISMSLVPAPPATGVTLSTLLASPQAPGTPVTFTAAATGSVGYQYQFWFFNGASWVVVQDFGAANTWTLPASTPEGSYLVSVKARTTLGSAGDVTSADFPFRIAIPPATAVTVTANPATPSPQYTGTPITFTAAASGSTAPYQYQFWLNVGGTWSIVQPWSATATWTMPGTTAAGTYLISVEARTSPNVARDVTSANLSFTLIPAANAPATGVTLTANPATPSPQLQGTPITFTAVATGGAGTYQYQFWVNNGVSWSIAQTWSATSTYTLPGSTPVGNYLVSVEVRTTTLVARDVVSSNVPFQITAMPATGVTLTANPATPSPQPQGTAITFTAQGLGSTTPYQYRFWVNNGLGWSIAQDYSATNTWTLPGTSPHGTYTVGVEVRTSPLVRNDAVSSNVSFTILGTPATSVSIAVAPATPSPQPVGTPIVFTATAVGNNVPAQYQWWVNSGRGWSIVQPWNASATWTMLPFFAPGTYTVGVEVRTINATRDAASPNVVFVLQ